VEQDRRLAMVGKGTMAMILAAAEKAGLIPTRTVTTEYGILREPATYLYPQRSAESARDMVRLMDEPDVAPDGQTYVAVTRTRTTYTETTTDWVPLSGPEENHD
jgi:hypothetical protein